MKRLILLAIVVIPVIEAERAQACSRDGCPPPVRLFYSQGEVPANLIRYRVLVDDPGPLELRAEDGTVIPSSIRTIGPDRVFGPDVEPAAGQTLTLHYRAICLSSYPDQPAPPPENRTHRFRVGPAGNVDLQQPSLTVVEKAVSDRSVRDQSVFVRYRYVNPDRSGSVSHLLDTTSTIDGRPFLNDNLVRSYCGRPPTEPSSANCNYVTDVAEGSHVVQVRTRIVGEREFTDELAVDTSCVQVKDLPDDKTEQPLTGAAGGCDLTGGHGRPGWSPLPLLAIAALHWLRVRRRQGAGL